MKLYAPKYYQSFSCIADKCSHSCCIGWEIDVDPDTMALYHGLDDGYGAVIKDSMDTTGDTPHFRLSAGDRCPHLHECGLCNIMTHLGEAYLCHICREHPRFYNDAVYGKEVGIGMACEEACRIILTSPDFAQVVEMGEVEDETADTKFDALPYRAAVFAVLSDAALTYKEKLDALSQAFDVSPARRADDEWREVLGALEYLDEGHRVLFEAYTNDVLIPSIFEPYLTRALAYFVYRHGTSAYDEEEFKASLGFGMFCVVLMASMAVAKGVCDLSGLVEIGRTVSEELEYSEENTNTIKWEFLF